MSILWCCSASRGADGSGLLRRVHWFGIFYLFFRPGGTGLLFFAAFSCGMMLAAVCLGVEGGVVLRGISPVV